ncbi:FtsK/SpoIIIE domain-containing protein [Brachyspira hyodysenteriae]|uniref:FtsK/SpoIIIE domain-containing protein n=1 Tax=Brachyspira hyodysenteriae TaxID=159 RepID=UPI0022CE2C1C|nr:FtsK/SpoIIIE domain-containing protein [Brachyspira hyodysenteriae]MCZ9888990.1 FtsK/SpoIIIE domain-containing protein [Brachyspira hyodysenteriae]
MLIKRLKDDYKNTNKTINNIMTEDNTIKEETKKTYNYPSLDLLNESKETISNDYINIEEIENILKELKINIISKEVKESRIAINYIFKYDNSIIKSYTLSTLENSLKCAFGDNIRLNKYYAPKTLSIEYIKTDESRYFGLKEVINDDDNFELPLYLGINTDNEKSALDLAKAPHMLIAGETGSGKSVCLASIITSLVYKKTPEELELMLIDKKNELSIFNELPHLIDNSLNNDDDIISALRNLEGELRERNNKITKKGTRNIQEYNKRARNKFPYIVLIIDELQDLLSRDIKKEAERIINTIASLGRSAGIHIIAAIQRPSAKVITGELKANLPTKLLYQLLIIQTAE